MTTALLVSLLLLVLNAFFVAAEFAFVKIRPTRLQQLANRECCGSGETVCSVRRRFDRWNRRSGRR